MWLSNTSKNEYIFKDEDPGDILFRTIDEVISRWNAAQIHSEIKYLIRVKLDVKPLAKTIH
jgi:hypothetical protein